MYFHNFRLYFLTFALLIVLFFTRCATFGTYETARTAPQGKFHIGGSITPINIFTSENIGGDKELAYLFFPLPEFTAKMGISRSFDLGVRWGFGPGMTFTSKYQFLKGPTDGAISLNGSFYGFAIEDVTVGFYGISPRFMLSSEAPNSFPFAINAGISYQGVATGAEDGTASGNVLAAVAGLGFPFRTGSTRSFRIMPEFSLTLPISTTFEAEETSGSEDLIGNFSISFGIGFTHVGPYEE